MTRTVLVAVALAAIAPSAMATEYTTDGAVLETFQCPEALKDDSERLLALKQYLTYMRDHHADWTIAKATGYRIQLLERHHCEESLEELRSHRRTRP